MEKVMAKKKTAAPEQKAAKRGRVSAYSGKKIFRLTKYVNFREGSDRMKSWKTITRDGISVDLYRTNAPAGSGIARRHLASFIEEGLVELRD